VLSATVAVASVCNSTGVALTGRAPKGLLLLFRATTYQLAEPTYDVDGRGRFVILARFVASSKTSALVIRVGGGVLEIWQTHRKRFLSVLN
jgi:hypothetical protein